MYHVPYTQPVQAQYAVAHAPAYAQVVSTQQSEVTYNSFQQPAYLKKEEEEQESLTIQPEHVFLPEAFIVKPTRFVNGFEEIQAHVEEAFEKTMGYSIPDNISLVLCSPEELEQAYALTSTWNEGIQGFCRHGRDGRQYVYVKKDELARVLLTTGHELGHALYAALHDDVLEEAKAFAFAMAWMNTIREHDIASLKDVLISENPAQNGLHNKAFAYVQQLLQKGWEPLQVFEQLQLGLLTIDFYMSTTA